MGVFDLQQLGECVMGGFEQANAGLLPSALRADLSVLRNTLAEGMSIQFEQLCRSGDCPVDHAERENFMTMQRQFIDNIPGYSQVAGNMVFNDY